MKKINYKLFVAILFLGSIIASCGTNTGNEHAEEEGHGHEEHVEGTVELTKDQRNAIDLKIVMLEKKNMTVGVKVTGRLEVPPQERADISPLMQGIVKSISVIEGDVVRKGQVLATLEHPVYIELQQDYVIGINDLDFLEKDYNRKKKMYDENVGSGRDFQKITAAYKNKKATVEALKIKLQMLGLNTSKIAEGKIYATVSITSPLNGTISVVETNIGAHVTPISRLFEVVNNSELHADFRVFEKDINRIAVGQEIYFTTTSLPGEQFKGKVHNISPVFEENPRALHIHADIDNGKMNLIPGMYIQGRIIADNVVTTTLPEHAIVSEKGKAYIFIRKDNAPAGDHWAFQMIEVVTGVETDGFVEVKLLSPLSEGQKIVGNGAYFLLAEMGKGETEHEH